MATGIERISAERARQVEVEGWTARHDDEHDEGEIAMAAACYASPRKMYAQEEYADGISFRDPWPWESRWDKRLYDGNVLVANENAAPEVRIRMLEKAGALIAAEIDRLLRLPGGKE